MKWLRKKGLPHRSIEVTERSERHSYAFSELRWNRSLFPELVWNISGFSNSFLVASCSFHCGVPVEFSIATMCSKTTQTSSDVFLGPFSRRESDTYRWLCVNAVLLPLAEIRSLSISLGRTSVSDESGGVRKIILSLLLLHSSLLANSILLSSVFNLALSISDRSVLVSISSRDIASICPRIFGMWRSNLFFV